MSYVEQQQDKARRGHLPLTNPNREHFANLRAQGLSLAEAYKLAGYAQQANGSNASTLAKMPEVADRIAFLQLEYGNKIKLERIDALKKKVDEIMQSDEEINRLVIQRELTKNLLLARSLGKIREANEAVRLLGETVGAFQPEPPRPVNVSAETARLGHHGSKGPVPTIAGTLEEVEHSLGDFDTDPDAHAVGTGEGYIDPDTDFEPAGAIGGDDGDTGED